MTDVWIIWKEILVVVLGQGQEGSFCLWCTIFFGCKPRSTATRMRNANGRQRGSQFHSIIVQMKICGWRQRFICIICGRNSFLPRDSVAVPWFALSGFFGFFSCNWLITIFFFKGKSSNFPSFRWINSKRWKKKLIEIGADMLATHNVSARRPTTCLPVRRAADTHCYTRNTVYSSHTENWMWSHTHAS